MSAELVTVAEVAEATRFSPGTVRNWVRAGACPNVAAAMPGNSIRIPRSWLEDFLAGRVQIPSQDAVVGDREGGPAATLPASAGGGGPHLRSVRGAATPRTA